MSRAFLMMNSLLRGAFKNTNLYNIRKRALERLKKKARIALSDADALCAIRCEQYVLDMFGIHKPLSSSSDLRRIRVGLRIPAWPSRTSGRFRDSMA